MVEIFEIFYYSFQILIFWVVKEIKFKHQHFDLKKETYKISARTLSFTSRSHIYLYPTQFLPSSSPFSYSMWSNSILLLMTLERWYPMKLFIYSTANGPNSPWYLEPQVQLYLFCDMVVKNHNHCLACHINTSLFDMNKLHRARASRCFSLHMFNNPPTQFLPSSSPWSYSMRSNSIFLLMTLAQWYRTKFFI